MLRKTSGVRSYMPWPAARRPRSVASRNAGRRASAIFRGLVREVCRIVPPVRSIARVLTRSSGRTYSGSGSRPGRMCVSPCHPRRMPSTSYPSSVDRYTTLLMTGFRPGTSPPPVRMPIRRFTRTILDMEQRVLGASLQEPLHEHDVHPAAVEQALLPVDADLPETEAAIERDACRIPGEAREHQLMDP